MGSSAGWKSVLGGVANIATMGYYGQYTSSKKIAKAQQQAAAAYAASNEKVAAAIESSSQASPTAVQATTNAPQQAAEANVYSAQKRKRTIASTANKTYARTNNVLGSMGGRSTL